MTVSSIGFRSLESSKVEKAENKGAKTPKVRSFGGSLGALALGGVVSQVAPVPISLKIVSKMQELGTLNPEDGKAAHNALKQMLQETGLKDKGVRIKFLSEPRTIIKDGKSIIASNGRTLDFLGIYRSFNDFMYVLPIREGKNAMFCPKDLKLPKITMSEYERLVVSGKKQLLEQKLKEKATYIKANSVLLSKDKLHTVGFHELGHAMNWNFSSFGRFLQKCRTVAMFAPMFIGIYGAVTKKSKPKNEGEKLTVAQKFNNFLRDNAGKLSFAVALPMLIEEGMATAKGNSFAKKLLSPELAKRVSKSNAVAYSSYLLTAVLGTLGAYVAVKVKDNAISKKETKLKLKQELELAKAS